VKAAPPASAAAAGGPGKAAGRAPYRSAVKAAARNGNFVAAKKEERARKLKASMAKAVADKQRKLVGVSLASLGSIVEEVGSAAQAAAAAAPGPPPAASAFPQLRRGQTSTAGQVAQFAASAFVLRGGAAGKNPLAALKAHLAARGL
jgi:hypothetical protein